MISHPALQSNNTSLTPHTYSLKYKINNPTQINALAIKGWAYLGEVNAN